MGNSNQGPDSVTNGSPDRVDGGAQRLTANQGVPVADDQHSLKVGLRGSGALEDCILREKITHFDHEPIPERVVHARGPAAHGYFERYEDLSGVTRAAPFAAAGKRTPVFVRFSAVAGARGRVAHEPNSLDGGLAQGLGLKAPAPAPMPMPLAAGAEPPQYAPSPALSLPARPGASGIATRRIAILAGHGVEASSVRAIYADLLAAGAVPRLVAPQLGQLAAADGGRLDVEISIEAGPPVLYDALIVADGAAGVAMLMRDAGALDFVRQQYRHCKPILALGAGVELLLKAGLPATLENGAPDLSLWRARADDIEAALAQFKQALAGHRHFQRETEAVVL